MGSNSPPQQNLSIVGNGVQNDFLTILQEASQTKVNQQNEHVGIFSMLRDARFQRFLRDWMKMSDSYSEWPSPPSRITGDSHSPPQMGRRGQTGATTSSSTKKSNVFHSNEFSLSVDNDSGSFQLQSAPPLSINEFIEIVAPLLLDSSFFTPQGECSASRWRKRGWPLTDSYLARQQRMTVKGGGEGPYAADLGGNGSVRGGPVLRPGSGNASPTLSVSRGERMFEGRRSFVNSPKRGAQDASVSRPRGDDNELNEEEEIKACNENYIWLEDDGQDEYNNEPAHLRHPRTLTLSSEYANRRERCKQLIKQVIAAPSDPSQYASDLRCYLEDIFVSVVEYALKRKIPIPSSKQRANEIAELISIVPSDTSALKKDMESIRQKQPAERERATQGRLREAILSDMNITMEAFVAYVITQTEGDDEFSRPTPQPRNIEKKRKRKRGHKVFKKKGREEKSGLQPKGVRGGISSSESESEESSSDDLREDVGKDDDDGKDVPFYFDGKYQSKEELGYSREVKPPHQEGWVAQLSYLPCADTLMRVNRTSVSFADPLWMEKSRTSGIQDGTKKNGEGAQGGMDNSAYEKDDYREESAQPYLRSSQSLLAAAYVPPWHSVVLSTTNPLKPIQLWQLPQQRSKHVELKFAGFVFPRYGNYAPTSLLSVIDSTPIVSLLWTSYAEILQSKAAGPGGVIGSDVDPVLLADPSFAPHSRINGGGMLWYGTRKGGLYYTRHDAKEGTGKRFVKARDRFGDFYEAYTLESMSSTALRSLTSASIVHGYDEVVTYRNMKASRLVDNGANKSGIPPPPTYAQLQDEDIVREAPSIVRTPATVALSTEHSDVITALLLRPHYHGGAAILSASLDGKIVPYHIELGSPIPPLRGHEGGLLALGQNNFADVVLSGGFDSVVQAWADNIQNKPVFSLRDHKRPIYQVIGVHDVRTGQPYVGVAEASGQFRIFDVRTLKIVQQVLIGNANHLQTGMVLRTDLRSDIRPTDEVGGTSAGSLFSAGGGEGTGLSGGITEGSSGGALSTMNAQKQYFGTFEFTGADDTGKFLVAGHSIFAFNMRKPKSINPLSVCDPPNSVVNCLVSSHRGVITITRNGFRQWSLTTGMPCVDRETVWCFQVPLDLKPFLSQKTIEATGVSDVLSVKEHTTRLQQERDFKLNSQGEIITCVAMRHDDHNIFVGTASGHVHCFDISTGMLLRTFDHGREFKGVTQLALHPTLPLLCVISWMHVHGGAEVERGTMSGGKVGNGKFVRSAEASLGSGICLLTYWEDVQTMEPGSHMDSSANICGKVNTTKDKSVSVANSILTLRRKPRQILRVKEREKPFYLGLFDARSTIFGCPPQLTPDWLDPDPSAYAKTAMSSQWGVTSPMQAAASPNAQPSLPQSLKTAKGRPSSSRSSIPILDFDNPPVTTYTILGTAYCINLFQEKYCKDDYYSEIRRYYSFVPFLTIRIPHLEQGLVAQLESTSRKMSFFKEFAFVSGEAGTEDSDEDVDGSKNATSEEFVSSNFDDGFHLSLEALESGNTMCLNKDMNAMLERQKKREKKKQHARRTLTALTHFWFPGTAQVIIAATSDGMLMLFTLLEKIDKREKERFDRLKMESAERALMRSYSGKMTRKVSTGSILQRPSFLGGGGNSRLGSFLVAQQRKGSTNDSEINAGISAKDTVDSSIVEDVENTPDFLVSKRKSSVADKLKRINSLRSSITAENRGLSHLSEKQIQELSQRPLPQSYMHGEEDLPFLVDIGLFDKGVQWYNITSWDRLREIRTFEEKAKKRAQQQRLAIELQKKAKEDEVAAMKSSWGTTMLVSQGGEASCVISAFSSRAGSPHQNSGLGKTTNMGGGRGGAVTTGQQNLSSGLSRTFTDTHGMNGADAVSNVSPNSVRRAPNVENENTVDTFNTLTSDHLSRLGTPSSHQHNNRDNLRESSLLQFDRAYTEAVQHLMAERLTPTVRFICSHDDFSRSCFPPWLGGIAAGEKGSLPAHTLGSSGGEGNSSGVGMNSTTLLSGLPVLEPALCRRDVFYTADDSGRVTLWKIIIPLEGARASIFGDPDREEEDEYDENIVYVGRPIMLQPCSVNAFCAVSASPIKSMSSYISPFHGVVISHLDGVVALHHWTGIILGTLQQGPLTNREWYMARLMDDVSSNANAIKLQLEETLSAMRARKANLLPSAKKVLAPYLSVEWALDEGAAVLDGNEGALSHADSMFVREGLVGTPAIPGSQEGGLGEGGGANLRPSSGIPSQKAEAKAFLSHLRWMLVRHFMFAAAVNVRENGEVVLSTSRKSGEMTFNKLGSNKIVSPDSSWCATGSGMGTFSAFNGPEDKMDSTNPFQADEPPNFHAFAEDSDSSDRKDKSDFEADGDVDGFGVDKNTRSPTYDVKVSFAGLNKSLKSADAGSKGGGEKTRGLKDVNDKKKARVGVRFLHDGDNKVTPLGDQTSGEHVATVESSLVEKDLCGAAKSLNFFAVGVQNRALGDTFADSWAHDGGRLAPGHGSSPLLCSRRVKLPEGASRPSGQRVRRQVARRAAALPSGGSPVEGLFSGSPRVSPMGRPLLRARGGDDDSPIFANNVQLTKERVKFVLGGGKRMDLANDRSGGGRPELRAVVTAKQA